MSQQQPATPSPIRRETPGSAPRFTPRRLWERLIYLAYLALMRIVGLLPPRPVEALFSTLAPLAYLLGPAKRRIADGTAASDPGRGFPSGSATPSTTAALELAIRRLAGQRR